MKYTDLVEQGASKTEKQAHLVGGDMTTITLRISNNLKAAGAEKASLMGISFSAYIRSCMMSDLVGGKDELV